MKEEAHPKYQKVLFIDSSTGMKYLCGTTLQPKGTETFEGKEYPAIHVAISSSSHPFFVGGKSYVDTEGRVDKFNKRYQAVQQKQAEKKQEEEEADTKKKKKAPAAAAKKKKPAA